MGLSVRRSAPEVEGLHRIVICSKAQAAAARYKLTIVFQDPNLEGLLVRLHRGQEQRKIQASDSVSELRKIWSAYQKPSTAEQLRQRFTLEDVRRAAVHDQHLRKLLEVIGLWP